MEALTKAEEKVMQILWDLKRGVVRDIIEKMPDLSIPIVIDQGIPMQFAQLWIT